MKILSIAAFLCLTLFLFSSNEITAQENQSKKKKTIAEKGWTPNQNPTRYFVSPSAFNLKKGQGYYQNVYVDLSFVNYGVTNWLSLGGGVELIGSLISTVHGEFPPLYVFTPKIGIEVGKNWHIGAGFMGGIYGGGYIGSDGRGSATRVIGLAFGNATYGSPDYNITFGAGFPISTETGEFISPVLMLSGTYRISRKISLISENLIMSSDQIDLDVGSIFGYGIRVNAEAMSIDIGFYNNRLIAQTLIIGVPYIDFTIRFGKH